MREAFAQLQAEGLVRIDLHRGAVVFHPTAEDLLEYYEIREVLESLAVKHAIDRLTPAIAKDLNELIDRMRRTTDAWRWLRMNDEFHLKLYECAHRPHLSSLIDNLRDASTPYIYMFVASRKPSDQANGEHQEILDACIRGDAKAAQRAIRDHLRHASGELAEQLSAARPTAPSATAPASTSPEPTMPGPTSLIELRDVVVRIDARPCLGLCRSILPGERSCSGRTAAARRRSSRSSVRGGSRRRAPRGCSASPSDAATSAACTPTSAIRVTRSRRCSLHICE